MNAALVTVVDIEWKLSTDYHRPYPVLKFDREVLLIAKYDTPKRGKGQFKRYVDQISLEPTIDPIDYKNSVIKIALIEIQGKYKVVIDSIHKHGERSYPPEYCPVCGGKLSRLFDFVSGQELACMECK